MPSNAGGRVVVFRAKQFQRLTFEAEQSVSLVEGDDLVGVEVFEGLVKAFAVTLTFTLARILVNVHVDLVSRPTCRSVESWECPPGPTCSPA